ncbi:MAG: hypothetical protein A2Y62_13865 [Candidatus Fischerbacteria bacterium RBG_13_37_8]|uniref:Uncharacterized protein n=1 Tax=Candidatus Fischerbacteria bacterium RBG_13_37_8 TaxID=1817863 RepID=A0A1F5VXG0_9BACT|nr:MAG: hypothetical protein A2Y62_13865 [Candidatus Fischerbacteria bacterium RBG_13_37_8]
MALLKCIVIMPPGNEFERIFEVVRNATSHSVQADEIECHLLKEINMPGLITDDIINSLNEAALCIADISGSNPNVMWVAGYAMALGKPTILIGQEMEELPFNLKVHRVILYSIDSLSELESKLIESVQQNLSRYEIKSEFKIHLDPKMTYQSLAVTGTSYANKARVKQRIKEILPQYIGNKAVWYCGSNGASDLCAIEYLLSKEEQVITVASDSYKMIAPIRNLIEQGVIQFLDASLEALPKLLTAPDIIDYSIPENAIYKLATNRRIFFCAKGDLVILFWDGKSQGISEYIRYLENNRKNMLIAYI